MAEKKTQRRRGVHASKRKTWQLTLREYVWPSMGIRAFFTLMKLNLMRQTHQPHEMALGFAVGVWAVFFPILGTHLVLSLLVCWMLGGNKLAAFLGNWIGNPWTYPVIWWASHKLGVWALGMRVATHAHVEEVDPVRLWQHLEVMLKKLLWPMMVGGQIIALPLCVGVYFALFYAVKSWDRRKKVR